MVSVGINQKQNCSVWIFVEKGCDLLSLGLDRVALVWIVVVEENINNTELGFRSARI